MVAIGIDLGATNLRVGVGTSKGKLLEVIRERTERRSNAALIKQITRLVRYFRKKYAVDGVGIATIGPIDSRKKTIIHTPNLPYKVINLKSLCGLNLPVFWANDCTAAVLAEKVFGAGKRHQNLVYVTMSSGIGAGAMVDDHLLIGAQGNAVECGHLPADNKYNLLCSCKKGRGHWEGYSSGNNLPRFFKAWHGKRQYKNAKEIFEAAVKGNRTARKFLDEAGRINARAISSIIVAYNPTLITFGGAVVLNNRKIILNPIIRYVDHFLNVPRMQITKLGEDIVLFGAMALVFTKQGIRI
jgi:glucokinase